MRIPRMITTAASTVILSWIFLHEETAQSAPYVRFDPIPSFYTIHVPEEDIEAVRNGSVQSIPGLNIIGAIIVQADDACGRHGVHMSGNIFTPLPTTPPLCGE